MPITITGPPWTSIRNLQQELSRVECTDTFRYPFGARAHIAVEQLTRFRDGGLRTPEFTTDRVLAEDWVRQGAFVLGRDLAHTRGADIVGPDHRGWPNKAWWSRAVDGVLTEWRIHVLSGRVIARGLKWLPDGATGRPRQARFPIPIRSRANGWRMRHDENPPKGIRPVAIAAVEALGYDHGAVDLLVTGEPHHEAGIARNDIVILEVNLIPAMDRYTCIQYAKAVARKFGVTYVPITAED